ncbi:TonB-dependent receptor domain-containing protein [Chromatocurvus halotolerans]|uniref:TonB-dependent receptor-like protein n=1 Tax=Chromatocurvus halotolerans TaxID=1132028 RepID=A0A4R2L038_9GAMM|nr:TonB-dependent receptor [Chromatocurvus halotolerans]TCO77026.1 TonB-dependent receptor-like protein [Chromatocurvus halotolerans]
MNHRRSLMARAVHGAVIAGTVSAGAGFAGSAYAQQDTALEEVVITGSRLRRDRDFVEVSPVATLDMEQIQGLGNLTLEQTVNRMPQLVPDTTSATNQYGGAAMSANLRGLGAVRTLVLVDGRRYIPAENTGIADLATIPDMLVESVEIVTGGASAVYGSDAIAGAINFRLRDDFQGAEFRYQRGETSEGDGDTERFDFLLGAGTDDGRGNVTFAASYSERGTIMGDARDFSAIPLVTSSTGEYVPFGSGNIPGTVISLQPAQFPLINGVDLSNSDGSCPGPIQGVRFDAGGQPVPFCRPEDQFNYAADNFLMRPMERYQISTLGRYQINSQVEAYAQFFYNKYEQAYQMAPESVAPTSFGQGGGTIVIPQAATNPLFSPQLQSFWAQNAAFWDADGDGDYVVNNTGRRFEEFGPRNFSFNIDSFMLTGGFRGDLEFGDRNWAWDTFYQYSRNETTLTNVGLLSKSGITLGLDAVIDDSGNVSCRTQVRGCVPVNIFGTDTLTPEMAAYLQSESVTDNRFEREVAGASIAGDLFELPAGMVAAAFGAEYREETISVVPNEAQLTNDLAAQAIAPEVVNGAYDIFEVFAETRIPLLNDQFGLQGLAVEGAARYADYSTIGKVSTYSGSLDVDVNEQVKLRTGYSRAIRAPNLDELLRPVSAGFRPVNDPCLAVNNPSAAVKQLCVQQGVPSNIIDTLVDSARSGYDLISGGNPNLEEEEADTLTAGFVLMPSMLPGLSLSLDYYRVELEGAISQVDGQLLLNDCFATGAIDGTSCQSITRDSNGNIFEVNAPLLNLASREVEGMDLAINYAFESLPAFLALPNHGATLDVQSFSSWQFTNETQVLESLDPIDCAGRYSGTCSSGPVRPDPDFRSLLRFNYRSGPLRLSPEVNYIGDLKLAENSTPNERGTQDAVVYVNLNGGWDITEKINVFFGINNLFDKQPPVWAFQAAGDLNVNVNLYDPQGRNFFAGVRAAL